MASDLLNQKHLCLHHTEGAAPPCQCQWLGRQDEVENNGQNTPFRSDLHFYLMSSNILTGPESHLQSNQSCDKGFSYSCHYINPDRGKYVQYDACPWIAFTSAPEKTMWRYTAFWSLARTLSHTSSATERRCCLSFILGTKAFSAYWNNQKSSTLHPEEKIIKTITTGIELLTECIVLRPLHKKI